MHEILGGCAPGVWILDLGSARGSFDASQTSGRVVRVDIEPGAHTSGLVVQADASDLPFPDAVFDAVIANHSLEHFHHEASALGEVARTLKRSGLFYVAVPSARTPTDKLYRWLARGGGHVNAYTDASELATRISAATGLPHAGTRLLYSGLSFLNRRNTVSAQRPWRTYLVGGGYEWTLRIAMYVLRLLDRWTGTSLSLYGWALYFGDLRVDTQARTNVCIRCGSGHPAAQLQRDRLVKQCIVSYYRCPNCDAVNLFTKDT